MSGGLLIGWRLLYVTALAVGIGIGGFVVPHESDRPQLAEKVSTWCICPTPDLKSNALLEEYPLCEE